jgi:hypothetical protein
MTIFGKPLSTDIMKRKQTQNPPLCLSLKRGESIVVRLHETTSTDFYHAHSFFDTEHPERSFGPIACVKNLYEEREDLFDQAISALLKLSVDLMDWDPILSEKYRWLANLLQPKCHIQFGVYLLDDEEELPQAKIVEVNGEIGDQLIQQVQQYSDLTNLFSNYAFRIRKYNIGDPYLYTIHPVSLDRLSERKQHQFHSLHNVPFPVETYKSTRHYLSHIEQREYLKTRCGLDLSELGLENHAAI